MVRHALDRGYEVVGVCRETKRRQARRARRGASTITSRERRTTARVIEKAVGGVRTGSWPVRGRPWGVTKLRGRDGAGGARLCAAGRASHILLWMAY